MKVIPFNEKDAYKFGAICAGLYKMGITIDDFDMHASSAINNNMTLVTNNTKHFRNISGLVIEDWIIRE